MPVLAPDVALLVAAPAPVLVPVADAAPVPELVPVPDDDGASVAANTSVLANVLQLRVAAAVGTYGTVVIAPRLSGGCAYDCVAPAASVYTPGTGNESESHTSNSPGCIPPPSVYLDGQLYIVPIRSSVCWHLPAGFEPSSLHHLKQKPLLPMNLVMTSVYVHILRLRKR